MTDSSSSSADSGRRYVLVASLLALALARFAFLGHAPLRFDEIFQLIRTLNLPDMGDSFAASLMASKPSAILHYGSIRIFGADAFGTRFPIVLQSLVIALATFVIARHVFDKRTAIIATFVSLLLPYNFAYGRYAQYDIGQTCWFALGAMFFICNDRRGLKRNVLSGLFFAMAFLGKFNALILQMILYFVFVVVAIRDLRAWRYCILNLVLFAVFLLVLKAPCLDELAASMMAWLGAIFVKSTGATGLSLGAAAARVLQLVVIAVTLPLFGVMLYSVVRVRRRPGLATVLVLSCVLYFLVLMLQGRIAPRYLNLVMPFACIVAAAGLRDLWDARASRFGKPILVALAAATFAQGAVSYGEYIRWEREHEPFEAIGDFARTELEPAGGRIFLPKNFPYNTVGIMQMETAWTNGVHDETRAGIYHLDYSPHSFLEWSRTPTSRMLLAEWIEQNHDRLLELGPAGLKREFAGFMDADSLSDTVHASYDLCELASSGILRDGDHVFVRDRSDVMYPSLWPSDPPATDTCLPLAGLDHEVVETFTFVNSERRYGRFVRIGR